VNQIDQAVKREIQAIASIATVAPAKEALTISLAGSMTKLGQTYQAELVSFYRAFTGERSEPEIRLTAEETELEKMTPEVVAGPAEFLEGRGKVESVPGLHGLMAFEVLGFVDGKRNGLQIYEATVAEALQGGKDYYGTVSPEKVSQYLQNLTEAGLVKMK
jgi:hypothetical protein